MKSLAKGPRAVLAENIAQALAEHFVLDPEDIESSLLKDARIVLKNTSLRQRRYRTPDAPNAVISVDGVVEEVIFSWRWSLTGGGKATSSQESSSGYATGGGMVQDAMLTIKGLKVRIGLEAFDDLDEEEQQRFICESLESTSIHESKGSSAKDEASKSQKEGYVQKYMQQIVDHLTLKIEDFEFIIQPANGPSITIGGNGIELGTLASAKMPANKDEEGATTTTVLSQKLLIRSFSIHASDGKSEENYPLIEPFGYAVSVTRLSGMRFQGGILSGLEIIGLQPPEERDVNTSIGDSQTNEGIVFHVGRLQIQALSAIGMLLAPASDPAVVSSPSSDDKDDAKKCSSSTVFNLPLPALTLVLPASEPNANATKITLSTATVVYRTDGKVFNIMGLGGIKDNGEPLISLADGGKWFVDFVNKSFVLEDASSDGGSTINISDEAVMRISSSVAALLASDEVLKLQNAWEGQESAVAVQDQDLKSESWSISTGAMTLRLTSDTKWLEATIAHFRTVLSLGVHGYTPTEAKVGGIVIRTSSSNTTIVTAPPFSLLSDVLLVPGTIEASVESVDKALEIKDFLLSFLEMTKSEQGSPAADSSSGIQALPFAVQLECVKCSVQDRDVDVYLKDVLGVGISFKCDDVIVRAERLKVELHKSNVTFPRIPSREDQNSADSMSLGFSSDRVLISFHDTPDHANITGVVRSTSVKTNVSILGSSLQIKLMEKIYLRMEDSKGGWVDGLIDVSEVSLILDDLLHPQSLECAGANITSSSFGLMKISVPPLLLSPTNEGSTIRIGQMKNDAVDVELGSIDIIEQAQEMFTAVLGESAENKGTSDASFSVPFPIQIPRINLSVGDPFVKVNMESVAVAYDDINIESIKCKGPNDTSCTLRSINLKLGMAIAVQIGKIEDIIIPHIARFAEPIENAVIVYNDNSLSMELDSVKVQMLKKILGDNNPSNGDDGEGFEIPFPVNVNIKNFNLSSVPTEDMSLQAAGIKMKIESIDGLVNIDTNDVMSIRVVHKNEWLQCSLYPTFIALPKTLTTVIAMTCGGVSVDNCSLGLVQATLPPCTLLPENDCVVANEALVVKIESSEVLQKLQGFVSSTSSQIEKKSSEQSPASTPFPIAFTLSKMDLSIQDPPMQLIGTTISLKDFLFKCASVSCKEVSGMSASIQDVEGNLLGSNVHVKVGRLSSLVIPGVFTLHTPVEDTSIVYKGEEGVLIDVNTVRGTFERPKTRKVQDSSEEHSSVSIPFPIQFNMKSLGLKDLDSHLMIAINNIGFSVSQTGSIYSLKTREGIPMRLKRSPDEWINAKLGSISLLLVQDNGCFKPHEMQFSGGTIGPCSPSCGELSIEIPPMQKDPGSLSLSFQSNMSMTVDSVDIFEKLRPLFESIVGPQDESSTFAEQSPASTPFPIAFTLSKMDLSIQDPPMQLIGTTISLKDFLFKCASVSCKEVSGMSASIQDVEGNLLGSNVHVKVGRLSSLVIPGVFTLHTPVEDTSIVYKGEEGVLIDVNTVRGTFERPKTRKVQDSSEEHSSVSIPFPIQFNMKSLGLKDLDSHLMIAINNIGFSVSQTGSIYSLKTREGIPMRLKRSPDEWINAKLGSISLLLVQDNGCFKPHEMQFSGGTIGPCSPSCGELSIEIPPMQKDPGSLSLSFQSNMSMTVDSVDIFEKLRPLFESIVGPQDESSTFDKFPFPVQIPGIKIFVSKTLLRIQIGSISAFESSVNIEHVHAINRVHVDSISTSMTCMKGLRVNIPTKRLEVSCVESLTTPVFALSKQLVKLGLSFENGVLAINIPSPIYLDMLSRGANTQQGAPRSQENDIDIPFPLKLAIAEVNVNTLISGSKSCVKMQQISCDIVPKVLPGQDLLSAEVKKGAQIAIMVRAVEHQLFQASNIRASLLIGLDDMETCNELNVSLTSVQVTAGFSSIDWTSMFDKTASENNTKEKSVKTPFANITGFSLSIAYKGIVVASGATVAVPNFGGDAFTTSHDLTSYYTNVVLKRAPGFLTNAEVLGTNVIDSTFANAGRVAMLGTSSLAGAGFGSVVGTVVADGLKGAISAGKTSRNADTADGYQFGDISRGLVRGLSQATKNGAESRGGGDGYVPGDFTVGAATAAADYTGRNKGKLASAGGAGMGSMVGMAVAGPLGFVVGSYVGGKIGKVAVEEDATSKCYLLFLFISLLQDSDNRYQYSYHPLQIKVQLSVPKMFTRKIIPIDNHIRQLIRRVPFTNSNSNSASSEGISLIILLVPRLDRIEFFHHHLTRLTMLFQFNPNNIILLLIIKPNNKVRLKHSITLAKPNSKLKLDPFLLNNTSKPATSSKLKPNIILVKPNNIILLLIIKPNNKVRLKHSITLAKPNSKLKLDPFLLNNTSKPATSSKLKPNIILVKPTSSNLKLLKGGINLETSLKVSSQKGRRPMAGTRKMDINLVS